MSYDESESRIVHLEKELDNAYMEAHKKTHEEA